MCICQVNMVKRNKKSPGFFPLLSLRKLNYNTEEACASYFTEETRSFWICCPQCNLRYHDESYETKLLELHFREKDLLDW